MANEEHLKILRQGVEVWNRWRKENPGLWPDLRGANLSKADLHGANLGKANLSRAALNEAEFLHVAAVALGGADLSGAKILEVVALSGARLSEADLRGAELSEVELGEANLGRANLSGANLSGAGLSGANFSGAHLGGTDLSGAWVVSTTFADLDLSAVKGLDTVHNMGPSTIGIDTIYKSRGQIPERFLRGCGLSDWEIEAAKLYQPDLSREKISDILYRIHDLRADRAIQINKLFISYSHANGPFVDCLETYLNEKGIRFWRDVHDATAGRLEKQIDRAMRLNPTVLLVLSADSVQSDWVEHEARLARELEKELGRDVLCPVALDDAWKTCRWPERLREQIMEYNILDFSAWQDEAFFRRTAARLIDGLDLFYKG
jgi:uncharacterized protein YjbI with pentapeptide repeats